MALRTTYSAESWTAIYESFAAVSFVSFDFDTIRQSLIDYTRLYYPEHYTDYIASAEFIALIESFAYIAEQLAYRIDVAAHENFITTAQRKQSILRLAKLISYKSTRNIAIRGLVKINTVATTEHVLDGRGIDLAGINITWNDPNNANWKEQFFLVMGRLLNSRFGQPQKTFQIGDVVMDLYSLRNDPATIKNGVFPFSASAGTETVQMEVVPADLNEDGPFEREPDSLASSSIIYSNDGSGDGSDYTGFLMFVKQGSLSKIDMDIAQQLPDRRLDFQLANINNTDVWVQEMNQDGSVAERWKLVETVAEQNLVFNDIRSTRKKFEVDSRENDMITIVFGDGDFSDAPIGSYRFWMRQSIGRSIVVQKSSVQNQPISFSYISTLSSSEKFSLSFGLTSTLQNGSATESIEHIRKSAPATYYAQNRMVSGQDYNTYMLKDPSIVRLNSVNRTFAGQPKYIDWNDASGQYENIKLFGDDLVMRQTISTNTIVSSSSGKALIDDVIEPLLSQAGIVNLLTHISASSPDSVGIVSAPRRSFIEDNRSNRFYSTQGVKVGVSGGVGDGSLKEKTVMQGLIDRHWYGEPVSRILDANNTLLAVILDPSLHPEDDSRIYDATLPRSIDGVNKYPPGDTGSGLQPISEQNFFGLRYNRFMVGIGNGVITDTDANAFDDTSTVIIPGWKAGETWTVEVLADKVTFAVRSNLRGNFVSGTIGNPYSITIGNASYDFLLLTQGTIPFSSGDAFVLDTDTNGRLYQRGLANGKTLRSYSFYAGSNPVNLNGWWEVMDTSIMAEYKDGMLDEQVFTPSKDNKQHSWVIFVRKLRQSPSNTVIGYEVHYREMKVVVSSPTTKFWYNDVDQILDSVTKKRVYDNIKILGSNLNSSYEIIKTNQVYDVIGAVVDQSGITDFNSLQIMPSDMSQENSSGDLQADRQLQFEQFASDSYEYFLLSDKSVILSAVPDSVTFDIGSTIGFVSGVATYGRNLRMPRLDGGNSGLDFMWQHFSPFTNIIDPSPTNIHDTYIITRGYYDNMIGYLRGTRSQRPVAPTPLELRNSYSALLNNKMMSDTVVLHPGKFKLLFGSLAAPQLRAKFKVVRMSSSSLTDERIKEEILGVVNTFFDIDGWDFGESFYATELIGLIHQRLPADIASVVLVPVYGQNSFGSLFTVDAGFDEVLQSCATISDIEIVEALTSTVIRQIK